MITNFTISTPSTIFFLSRHSPARAFALKQTMKKKHVYARWIISVMKLQPLNVAYHSIGEWFHFCDGSIPCDRSQGFTSLCIDSTKKSILWQAGGQTRRIHSEKKLIKKDPDKSNEPKDAKTHITKKLSKIWPKCNFN